MRQVGFRQDPFPTGLCALSIPRLAGLCALAGTYLGGGLNRCNPGKRELCSPFFSGCFAVRCSVRVHPLSSAVPMQFAIHGSLWPLRPGGNHGCNRFKSGQSANSLDQNRSRPSPGFEIPWPDVVFITVLQSFWSHSPQPFLNPFSAFRVKKGSWNY